MLSQEEEFRSRDKGVAWTLGKVQGQMAEVLEHPGLSLNSSTAWNMCLELLSFL